MSNVVTFPRPDRPSAPAAVLEEIASYGSVGPITVALARRTDVIVGLIHVVVIGASPWVGVEVIATLPDNVEGRAVADFTGPAVVRAVELAETEFAAREAC